MSFIKKNFVQFIYKEKSGAVTKFKGYLRYKAITSQNVLSEAQVKNFFIS